MVFLCSHALVFSWVQESKFLKFLGFMWNPLSWVMEAAAIMAIIMTNGGVKYHPLLWEQTDNLWVAVAHLKMWSILASVICGCLPFIRISLVLHKQECNSNLPELATCFGAGPSTRLAGLHGHYDALGNQLYNQFHRGKQCRECCSIFDGTPCPQD